MYLLVTFHKYKYKFFEKSLELQERYTSLIQVKRKVSSKSATDLSTAAEKESELLQTGG